MKKDHSSGFTLIELIIAISITVVAGSLLIVILGQNNNIFLQQESTINEGMSANNASLVISDAIKQAAAIAASSPTNPVYTTNINTIVLQLPSIDGSGNIISNSFDYIVIAPDNSKPAILRYQVFPTSPSVRASANRVLLTNLASLRF